MPITLYHNPRCSKSREALRLLTDRGIEPTIVEYLLSPPDSQELGRILDLLGMAPRELMRVREPVFREQKLDDPGLSRDQLIAAMIAHPILIERPIIVAGDQARLGRPPQKVLEVV